MQIYFDNIFGHQTDRDLLFNVVSAHFEKNEYNYAFENGWSPINFWFDGLRFNFGINQEIHV